MKVLVLLVIGLLDATYASKCIGDCVQNGNLVKDLLAHEDCNKFCVCTSSEPREFICRQGLHFSIETQACVDPSKANCRDITTSPDSSTSPPITSPTTPPVTPPTTPPPSVDKNGCIGTCPPKNSDDFTVLLPNTNCSKYCMCNWGTAIPKDCLPDLFFNNDTQTCDYPFNVDCPNITRVNEYLYNSELLKRVFSPFGKVDKQEEKREKKIGCRFSPEEDDEKDGCIGKCPHSNSLDYTVHLPHKECTKFCKCNWGIPVVQNCPKDLHFNSESETCDFIFTANCTGIGKLEDLM